VKVLAKLTVEASVATLGDMKSSGRFANIFAYDPGPNAVYAILS